MTLHGHLLLAEDMGIFLNDDFRGLKEALVMHILFSSAKLFFFFKEKQGNLLLVFHKLEENPCISLQYLPINLHTTKENGS